MTPRRKSVIHWCIATTFIAFSLSAQDAADSPEEVISSPDEQPESVTGPAPELLEPELLEPELAGPELSEDELETAADPETPSGLAETSEMADPIALQLDRFEQKARHKSLMEQREWDLAAEAAQKTLAMTEDEIGPADLELVEILNDLGASLIMARRPEEAVQYYERSIDLSKDLDGIFSERLVHPYTGLGRAMAHLGNHEAAVGFFQRGQHITHRHEGVGNLSQLPIMRRMESSLRRQGQYAEARSMAAAMLKVNKIHYGEDNPLFAQALIDFAAWHKKHNSEYRFARFNYHKSVNLRLSALPEEDLEMTEPLRALAMTYYETLGPYWINGRRFGDTIIDNLTIKKDEMAIQDRVFNYLRAGDLLTELNDPSNAALCYVHAWEIGQGNEGLSEALRDELYRSPVVLNMGMPLEPRFLAFDRSLGEAYSDFEFNIGSDGRPRDIKVIDSNLRAKNWKFAAQNFRQARFRPRIDDGQVRGVDNVSLRKIFTGPDQNQHGAVGSTQATNDTTEQATPTSNP